MTKKVVLTGFGPFGGFNTNPSQLVVQKLEEWDTVNDDIELVTCILPVTYSVVMSKVEDIWTKDKPDLVVHVGVHGYTDSVLIERQSFNFGYCRKDVTICEVCGSLDSVPGQNCCVMGSDSTLCTKIDVERLIGAVSLSAEKFGLTVKPSDNPGRYLCAYSYYKSLSRDPLRVLFVHIPPAQGLVTVEAETEILKQIIISSLKQTL